MSFKKVITEHACDVKCEVNVCLHSSSFRQSFNTCICTVAPAQTLYALSGEQDGGGVPLPAPHQSSRDPGKAGNPQGQGGSFGYEFNDPGAQLPVFSHSNLSDLDIAQLVIQSGKLNSNGLMIPLKSCWNIQLLKSLATSDYDNKVIHYLTYGWPINRQTGPVCQSYYNHPSANRYPTAIRQYLCTELSLGTLLGPFATSPFPMGVTGISPMSTTPKKDSDKRRIIVDLSWPVDGDSVNSRIPKDLFMGTPAKLRYPTVDDLCKRAFQLGAGKIFGYKKDMSRAFKQLPLDALCWSMMGIYWAGALFFDKSAVMGCRSAPFACQSTTNLIRHFMENLSYILFNYIDDFMGIELKNRAWEAYNTLGHLLRDLGAHEAENKAVPPCEEIEFLGIWFNLKTLIMTLPKAKLTDTKALIRRWLGKETCTKNQLEKLIGKLQFAATCIRPGRVFIIRLYQALKDIPPDEQVPVPPEVQKDILWWEKFLEIHNGKSIMWMNQKLEADTVLATDASKTGLGGVFGSRYFKSKIPQWWVGTQLEIANLELWALIIALKLWCAELKGTKFVVACDNESVVMVLNSGYSRNMWLQRGMREVAFLLATNDCEMHVVHVKGKLNTIPDLLSRFYSHKSYQQQLKQEWKKSGYSGTEDVVQNKLFKYSCDW